MTHFAHIWEHGPVIARRFLAVLAVAAWLTPAAGAMAISMHVARHHHDHGHPHHELGHELLTALHAHHHCEVLPHHDHSAPPSQPPSLKAESEAEPPPTLLETASVRTSSDALSRAAPGSTPPLFYSHCSLRL